MEQQHRRLKWDRMRKGLFLGTIRFQFQQDWNQPALEPRSELSRWASANSSGLSRTPHISYPTCHPRGVQEQGRTTQDVL